MIRIILAILIGLMAMPSLAQISFLPSRSQHLATSTQIPENAVLVQPPASLVDEINARESMDVVIPSPTGTWVVNAERFGVLAPDAQIVAATPNGDIPFSTPPHAMLMGSVKGMPGSRVFLAAFDTHGRMRGP